MCVCVCVCVQQWCNDTDRGKTMYLEKKLIQCHCVQHKSYKDSPGIEAGTTRDRPATDRLNPAEEAHQPTKYLRVGTCSKAQIDVPRS